MNNKSLLLVIGVIIILAGFLVVISREATPPNVSNPVPVATSSALVATSTAVSTSSAPVPKPVPPAPKPVPVPTPTPAPVQIQDADAAQLFALTNSDRQNYGLSSLTYSLELQQVAEDRANELATTGYFSHGTASSTDLRFTYWMKQVGYPWKYAGENLGEGFTAMPNLEMAFMNSPEHRYNILLPQYTEVGIAFSNGVCNDSATCGAQFGQQTTFTVVIFGSK